MRPTPAPSLPWPGTSTARALDSVVPGSAAEKAGMKAGDILMRFAGKPVTGLGGFNELLREHQPGDHVRLEWTRDGTAQQGEAELTAR